MKAEFMYKKIIIYQAAVAARKRKSMDIYR
jgi:hypothetical protein